MLLYPQSPGTKPNHEPAGNLVRGGDKVAGGGKTWLGWLDHPIIRRARDILQSGERRWRGDLDPQHTGLEADTHTHQLPPAAAFTFLIPRLGPSAQCLNLNSQPSIVWVVVVVARPCVPATSSEDAVLFTSH